MHKRRGKYFALALHGWQSRVEKCCQLGRKQAASLSPITPTDLPMSWGKVNLLISYEREGNYFPIRKER